MRLLNVNSLRFTEFHDDNRPDYVAASHRWTADEATFQNVQDGHDTKGKGCEKVEAFAEYIRDNMTGVEWLWIDTCCIDKTSAAELSEAVNSMFEWYRMAKLCLAYLADVKNDDEPSSFEKSEWFKRGWTLQELLAPSTVVFVTKGWQVIGYKGDSLHGDCLPFIGPDLSKRIARSTGIPEQVLRNYRANLDLSVHDKMKWMEGRKTTRPEDMSYALFGILGVTLPVIYGEKYEGARQRLLDVIHQRDNAARQQVEYYRKIADWLSSPDPSTNHESARQRHEPQTGTWLLHHNQYNEWKSGSTRFLWIHGKAGCGKTILCFTAIENIRLHYNNATNTGQAIFYFSFSDKNKQTFQNLVYSLVIQLCAKGPGLSMLRQAYEKPERRLPGTDEVQKILLSSIMSYDQVFLHLDALDECPEDDGVRENVLNGIDELLRRAPNVRMLVTSRDVPDVRGLMDTLETDTISIAAQIVNADIRRYVSTQLSRDRKLSRLDLATRTLVEETLSQKADGMFRWVYCQLQELRKSKSTKPKSVKAALLALPATLDETYQRMLNNIKEDDRPYALTLLRWLAYAQSPPSLDELAEASIIDLTGDTGSGGVVDIEDRGGWGDTLEILAGLVIIEGASKGETGNEIIRSDAPDDSKDYRSVMHDSQWIKKDTKVRLAHFSVKEYLESPRILASDAKYFHLEPAKEHRFLTQSCLVYLMHYSDSSYKTSTRQDLAEFPLLEYAAKRWGYHASLQQWSSSTRELSVLTSEVRKRDWLLVHDPDQLWVRPFEIHTRSIGTALYCAGLLGLETLVQELLIAGADTNAQGGRCGNALQVASERGDEKVVQILMDAGADVNAQGGLYGNALQAASERGDEKVVQMLMDAGADVNAQGGFYSNALYAASARGHEKVVQMLMDAGADVNAQGGFYSNALYAASARGHEKVVQMLMDAGADVNAQGGFYGNALQAASFGGDEKVVQMLMDAGADVNAQGGDYGNALQAALARGHEKVVQMLMDAGADVNAQGGFYGNALQAASFGGDEKVVQMLMDAGADVNAQGGDYGNALQAALARGHEKVVQMLMDAGADVNAQESDMV